MQAIVALLFTYTSGACIQQVAYLRVSQHRIPISASTLIKGTLLWPWTMYQLGPGDVWDAAFSPDLKYGLRSERNRHCR